MKKLHFKLILTSKFYFFFQRIGLMLLVFASRFIGFAPNFSLVGSYGFFGGNLILFIAQILIFDLLRGGLYRGFVFTYLGFLAYGILGKFCQKNKYRLLMLPLASFLFFLISNFGVWLYWYDHNLKGLLNCYLLALPFYKNTLLSDVFFGSLFLGLKQLGLKKNILKNKFVSFLQYFGQWRCFFK